MPRLIGQQWASHVDESTWEIVSICKELFFCFFILKPFPINTKELGRVKCGIQFYHLEAPMSC